MPPDNNPSPQRLLTGNKTMRFRRLTRHGKAATRAKGQLRHWASVQELRAYGEQLAAKVQYRGNPKHKRNPGNFGLTPPAQALPGATLCDDSGVCSRQEATALLRDGAMLGLVDVHETNGWPRMIWSVRQHDHMVFEARLENRQQGHYHGYPMHEDNPFRADLIAAYRERSL